MAVLLMSPEEKQQRAFGLAVDIVKQLLTLTTGLMALTITVKRDVLKDAPNSLFIWAWLCGLLSILAGLFTLLSMVGASSEKAAPAPNATSVYNPRIQLPAMVQAITFLACLVLLVWAGLG